MKIFLSFRSSLRDLDRVLLDFLQIQQPLSECGYKIGVKTCLNRSVLAKNIYFSLKVVFKKRKKGSRLIGPTA